MYTYICGYIYIWDLGAVGLEHAVLGGWPLGPGSGEVHLRRGLQEGGLLFGGALVDVSICF